MDWVWPIPDLANHRQIKSLIQSSEFATDWNELTDIVNGISEEDIIECHESNFANNTMSLSRAINHLLKGRFVERGWKPEAYIFQDREYRSKVWRLDFAKNSISVEVSFNHGEALAWNMIKPTIASELNHVKKEIDTKIGVIILATEDLKLAGCFDGSVGTWEKAITYLKPLQNQLTVPLFLMGIRAPYSFRLLDNGRGNQPRSTVVRRNL
jgi:hypothetical protein